ncbi:unnamed protein product [Rotaria sp. Silwood2]|nr:unnamed protein product [Rotaria sp. Silwood2]CAF4415884.1 unnamed protein product [Rotaria sp. Silwood2]
MVINTQNIEQELFYLNSNKNRHRYPPSKYPLTHLLDRQSIDRRLLKQPKYVKNFIYSFACLTTFILISMIFFQAPTYVYNTFCGPFHLNLEDFIKHVKSYKNNTSWFWRKEYIQIELGEHNIQNQVPKYETFQQYSDLYTRRNHIATFKKLKIPKIFVKLPNIKKEYACVQLPFDFSLYSLSTLQCIVKNLPLNSMFTYKTWVIKSEYVDYINKKYSENPSKFNVAVLTKCGILIGYLYEPVDEIVFIANKDYKLHSLDLTFDATRQYYSSFKLVIGGLMFILLLIISLFNLIIYVLNMIRFKLFNKYESLSFPLDLLSNVLEELWLLNIDDPPHEQLLQLDELIRQSQHRYSNQLCIIKNYSEHLFVIILRENPYQSFSVTDGLSPFIICPVTDIKKITEDQGICYGEDSSWIQWPTMLRHRQHFSHWLHEELMQISEDYKREYEYHLQHERQNRSQAQLNYLDWNNTRNAFNFGRISQRGIPLTSRTRYLSRFDKFVREEENFQRLKFERQDFLERILVYTTPASPQFIANFRIQAENNKRLIDLTMKRKQYKCMICLEELKLNDLYATWPCPSTTPHIFHHECMLNTLRMQNTCPICRHPV